jgi:hypothetical protein
MMPGLQSAIGSIPPEKLRTTELHVRGTAGMRLLDSDRQDSIWNALCFGLRDRSDVPFIVHKNNFGTISGKLEAYYAVCA